MNTNRLEAIAASAASTTTFIGDFNDVLQLLIGVATLAWWLRLWLKNPNVPPPPPISASVKKTLPALMLPLIFLGCASQRILLTEESADGNRKHSTITTRTFWDAKSELAKTKTSNTDKTQSIGTDGATAEGTGTNTVSALRELRAILGK